MELTQKDMGDRNMSSAELVNRLDARVRAQALALLDKDRDFDDKKYTPPGAIGLGVRPRSGSLDTEVDQG